MSYTRLIYASRPFGYDNAMLAGILLDARRCNSRELLGASMLATRSTSCSQAASRADSRTGRHGAVSSQRASACCPRPARAAG